jgi:hypothetical protein
MPAKAMLVIEINAVTRCLLFEIPTVTASSIQNGDATLDSLPMAQWKQLVWDAGTRLILKIEKDQEFDITARMDKVSGDVFAYSVKSIYVLRKV